MKALFLDVDGVLNCAGCKIKTPSGFLFVEDIFLIRIRRIIDETDAKVILSSTWRHGHYDMQRGDENTVAARDYVLLRNKLSEFGIIIYSHTPELDAYHRGMEISVWLAETAEKIDSFVILDDDTEIHPLQKSHVRTFFDEGIQENHVEQAIRILTEVA